MGHKKTVKKIRNRACDQCRRRKVRCNGGDIPIGSRCANCVAFEYDCTYIEIPNKKRFAKPEYVMGLENEIVELKRQLAEHSERSPSAANHDGATSLQDGSASSPRGPSPSTSECSSLQQDETEGEELVELLRSMDINVKHTHFMGKASSLTFVRTALALKKEFMPSSNLQRGRDGLAMRQPEFYDSMMRLTQQELPYPPSAFPHPTLMAGLIHEYFSHSNLVFPLLHRPTFEHGLRTGLHLRDEGFGATVLLVCAIGSRFSNDVAVLPEGIDCWHWAGWRWFQQVNARKLVHLSAPRLYDLQLCVLIATYMCMSPAPHAMHSVVGYGIRLAKDLGVHRRATYGPNPTVEDDLKRRAFWCLIILDRNMCVKLGRPYNVEDDDFDVDFPVECDDEYWFDENGELVFAQPAGLPSNIVAFNCRIQLSSIHAEAYRRMCRLHGSSPEQVQMTISELDSKLNNFIDSLPSHLKWESDQDNHMFRDQAALIYTAYYYIQIIVHRSFVPIPQRSSSLSPLSLAVCTNAARCSLNIIEIQSAKKANPLHIMAYWNPSTLFSSATVLLLNVWNAKSRGQNSEASKDIQRVEKVGNVLQTLEKRWLGAAILGYVIQDVMSVVTKPLPNEPQRRKREYAAAVNDPAGLGPASRRVEPPCTRFQQPHDAVGFAPIELASCGGSAVQSHPSANNYHFTLPTHRTEPTSLPVWPAAGHSNIVPTPCATGHAWPVPGDSSSFVAAGGIPGADQGPAVEGFDPELEAIFANLFPDIGHGNAPGLFPHGVVQRFNSQWAGQEYDVGMTQARSMSDSSSILNGPSAPRTEWAEYNGP